MVTGQAIAIAMFLAVGAPPADDVEALADQARARASQWDETVNEAVTQADIARRVQYVEANRRDLVGADLEDSLPAVIESANQTYAVEVEQARLRGVEQFEAGIELARELAGGQVAALEASGEIPSAEEKAWREPRYRLFITQSMPDAEIASLVELARQQPDVVLVLRGLRPGQKLTEIYSWLAPHLRASTTQGRQVPNITLDPEPFNALGVADAPALARYDDNGQLVAFVLGVTSTDWLESQIAAGGRGNLGAYGPTVPVIEEDIIEAMKARASQLDFTESAAGALDRFWKNTPLHGLPRTRQDRVRTLDPTFEISETMAAPDGTVIARAGDRFNPLEAVPFSSVLGFFDPADEAQVAWAQRLVAAHPGRKVTLMASQLRSVDGLEGLGRLADRVGAKVFSLPAEVRNTFHIESVPTVVTAQGLHFHIHEQVP